MYCAGAAFGLAWALMADVIQLKDQAAITGTILAEKPDQLVVDVGYTVLIVPRERVETITRTGAGNAPSEPGRESAAGPKPAGTGGSAPDAGNATVAPAPGLSGAAGRGGLFAASSGAGQDR